MNRAIAPLPPVAADPNPILTRRELRKNGVRVLDGGDQGDAVVACGLVGKVRMDGIHANFGRRMQVDDLDMEVALDAQVCIKIFLEGFVEASLNGVPMPMPQRTEQGRWQSSAIIVSHGSGARLRRRARKGQYLDKMVIGMSREWLQRFSESAETPANFRALLGGEPGFWQWRPNCKVEFLARQMFDIAARKPPFSSVLLESHTLAIVYEALTTAFGASPEAVMPPTNLTAAEQQRIYALVRYIDRHSAQELAVTAMASELGASQATLQRLVRKAHNCSLNEFIRNRWLDEARQALLFSNRSISEIAFEAGYVHLSNFTAAFRKRFGYPPSSLRRHAGPAEG
ncbi:AraC family transcriptional regulator [Agrobacterium leguminum]|uniref:AraC family transcriptional regulator n=1 Tax=Agrobacterium leguminum TaxID=2792015 RepID=A0A9X3KIM9_9HYPH|nr:AraC family transcriptional regulator [Agrobacterium leguminum]MCZ7912484.1 AraC family transcriptional regulator [Agrobacterium leguminum]